jgi:hypothetical protein
MRAKVVVIAASLVFAVNVGYLAGQLRAPAADAEAARAQASQTRILNRIDGRLRGIDGKLGRLAAAIGSPSVFGDVTEQLRKQRTLLYETCKNTGETARTCSISAGF